MEFSLNDIIKSLLNDRSSLADPITPDGVADFSFIVDALLPITKEGRALRSDAEYGVAQFYGQFLSALVPTNPTNQDYEKAIMSLILLLENVITTVCGRYGDTSHEEILIDAANQDWLRAQSKEFSAVPIRINADESVSPLFGLLHLFAEARPITDKMRDGYVIRRWLPFATSSEGEQTGEQTVEATPDADPPRIVNLSELGDLVADANNGFDDYDAFYFDNQDRYHDEHL